MHTVCARRARDLGFRGCRPRRRARRSPIALVAASVAALVLSGGRVRGQVAPLPGTHFAIVARDSAARMERVADGVYAIIHAPATRDEPNGNTGVVVGPTAVLVVDSDYSPGRAAADIALIRTVTSTPVRYLVNTHWHGDHTHGNSTYRREYPAISIVSSRANRQFIDLNQVRHAATTLRSDSYSRQQLAAAETALRAGKDSSGKPFIDAELARLRKTVAERRTELDEARLIGSAPPTRLFDDSLIIDLGRPVRVVLRNEGRANSPSDVTAYVPSRRVLFTGDIVVYPRPYVGGSFPGPWIGVLRRLEGLPVSAVVPGHGPVLPDNSYITRLRDVFEITRARVDSAYRSGRSLDEIPKVVNVDDLRSRFRGESGDPFTDAFWRDWTTLGLLERMAQCVHGYRC